MTPFTREEKIHHLQGHGDKCPCCDSKEVETESNIRAYGTIALERHCKDCKAQWTDTYELTDVDLTKESAA